MASVIINEKDYTESSAYEPTETIVYVPGMPGADCEDIPALVNEPIKFTSEEAFVKAVGSQPWDLSTQSPEGEIIIPAYDKSYVIARQLLALGVTVLYEVVADPDDETLATAATTEIKLLNRLSSSLHWAKLYDRALFNPRFITSGGYANVKIIEGDQGTTYNAAIAKNMLETAAFNTSAATPVGRGDCVALIDHDINVNDIDDIKNIFNSNESPFRNIANLGTFGAAFTPWCAHELTINPGVESPDADNKWSLPGSFAYLVAYAAASAQNPTWYAAAGVTRGACPTLYKPLVEFGEMASNALQSREDGFIAVNPICNITGYGYRVFGNRTLRQNGINNTSNLVATSFLNIRNLISDIKKTSFAACRRVTFEQNTDVLWFNLKAQITPLLEKMKAGNGISDYKIIRQRTNIKGLVKGIIRIIPIEAVEDFELTLELTDALDITTAE